MGGTLQGHRQIGQARKSRLGVARTHLRASVAYTRKSLKAGKSNGESAKTQSERTVESFNSKAINTRYGLNASINEEGLTNKNRRPSNK